MRGWSIPLGRWFGVELRIHTFFVLLATLCVFYAHSAGVSGPLGLFFWLFILAAVLVRESARLFVAAWFGLRLRVILLMPLGAHLAYADPDSQDQAANSRARFALTFAGPFANLATAAILAAGALGASGSLNLLAQPLITPAAIIRSAIWIQVFLGVLNLAPAYPLDAGRLLRTTFTRAHGPTPASRALAGLGQFLALAAIFAGLFLHDPVLPTIGFFLFISAQIEDQGVFFQSVVDTVRLREVMLTDFSTLSPTDTLADALARSIHSLQEDFPVVRDRRLVGIVNRQRIVDQLRIEGNGYIQGVMTRNFQVARPEDTLGAIIRRLTAGRGLSLIPVAEGETIVGMVSVQNLMSAMTLLSEQRHHERMER